MIRNLEQFFYELGLWKNHSTELFYVSLIKISQTIELELLPLTTGSEKLLVEERGGLLGEGDLVVGSEVAIKPVLGEEG